MQVGTRVRYIFEDTEEDKLTGYYPPVGTLGTVERYCGQEEIPTLLVQWDSGTKGDGRWWCEHTQVEVVEEN